jgi:uncharacterized protein YkwD
MGRIKRGFTVAALILSSGVSGCNSFLEATKDIVPTPQTPNPTTPAVTKPNSAIAPSATKPNSVASNPSRFSDLEAAVHKQVNQYRQSVNLPPLTFDPSISAQARVHSQAMASGKAGFSHVGFEDRVKAIAKSIPYTSAAENLAYNEGYSDPVNQAVKGWIKSPGHRVNMEGNFDLTGVGVVKTPQGRYYMTQIFIRKANKLGF